MASPGRRRRQGLIIDPSQVPNLPIPRSSMLPRPARGRTTEVSTPRPDSILLPPLPSPMGNPPENQIVQIEIPRIPSPEQGAKGVEYYSQGSNNLLPPTYRRFSTPSNVEESDNERPVSQDTEALERELAFSDDEHESGKSKRSTLGELAAGVDHEAQLFGNEEVVESGEEGENPFISRTEGQLDGENSTNDYVERVVSVESSPRVEESAPTTTTHVYQNGEHPVVSMTVQAASGHDETALDFSSPPITGDARHYEGCMLCSPLPSPGSSLSSVINEREFAINQTAGPPPNEPLPENPDSRFCEYHRGSEFNPLKPFLEGEVVAGGSSSIEVLSPKSRPNSVSGISIVRPGPHATDARRGSLSTLIEGDEDTRGSRSRPQTAETSRLGTSHYNGSQSSLIHNGGDTSNSPKIPQTVYQRTRNIFGKLPALSSIQEAPRRKTWMGMFGRGEQAAPPPVVAPTALQEGMLAQEDLASKPAVGPNLGKGTETPNQHPGIRRDTPGVDGSYEMVDLGQAPQRLVGLSSESVELLRDRPHPKRFLSKRFTLKFFLGLLILVAVLITTILPILLVGFPKMAQKAVDNAGLIVTSFSLTGAQPNAVMIGMDVSLTGSNKNAWVQPASLKLSQEDKEVKSTFKPKTDPLNGASTKGTFGFLKIAEKTKVGQGVTTPVKLSGENDGYFSISDTTAWGELMEALIFEKDGVKAVLEGEVTIKSNGLSADCKVKKTLFLPGMGGFGISVLDYQILQDGRDNFTAALELVSNSSIVIAFDNVDFDLIFGTTVIGTAGIRKFTIKPGKNTLEITGILDKKLLQDNPVLFGGFLSALYRNNPTSERLLIRGNRSTIRGEEIKWLSNAIKKLEIPLPGVSMGPEKNIVEEFGMELSFSASQPNPAISSGNITNSLNLAFPTNGLATIVTKIGYNLELSVDDQKFARIDTPISQSMTDSKGNKVSVEFSEANLTISDMKLYGEKFLKPILQKGNFTINTGGKLTVELQTQIGNATVKDIILSDNSWKIEGYEGIGKGNTVKLRDVELFAHKDGLLLLAKMHVRGSGSLNLSLGTIHFNTGYGENNDMIGTLTVPSFSISKGQNIIDATILISPKTSTDILFDRFLSQYMSGGEVPLQISAAQDKSSTIPYIASAFNGVGFLATMQTPTHLGFLSEITFYITKDSHGIESLEAELVFINLFKIPMSIDKLDLQFVQAGNKESFGRINKSFDQKRWVSPGQSEIVAAEFYPGLMGMTGVRSTLETGPKDMEIRGTTVVGWSDFSVDIVIDVTRPIALRN
ncbi:hypothetical protein EDC01DRAFT_758620 [Geopyxis carbonaria]|nr:hypothetical protein EDC01DRAFT_758620 [Geopyxis carbonaria]